MCTVAVWKNNGIAVVTGRTLDWHEDLLSNLWILPAGQSRIGLVNSNSSLNWESKYGSIVTSGYDIASADGFNEKGLAMHLLWLVESDYGTPNPELPTMAISLWGQYYIDNFATVAEAVEHTRNQPFNVVTATIGTSPLKATMHLSIEDSTGDMAIFEYIQGELRIHHSDKYNVMTNSPSFDQQLSNLKRYEGYGGTEPLPGTTAAADRFVRAAYYLSRLNKPKNIREALAGVMSVVRNTSQPFGMADPKQPNISPTLWRTLIDHKNLTYYFESTTSPFLVWSSLNEFDISKGADTLMYNISAHSDSYGKVSKLFEPAKLFDWAMPTQ